MSESRTGDRLVLRLKVSPRAAREAITRATDGSLRLAVTAAPERGKANAAAIALLAKALGVPKTSIAVIRGASARQKTLRIVGDARLLTPKIEALGRG